MIALTPIRCSRINALFLKEHKAINPDVVHIMELVDMFDTYNVASKVLGMSFAYWEFLHACLDNIETGNWTTLPRMWIEYCQHSRELVITLVQAEAEYRHYLLHRERVLHRLGLSAAPHNDHKVILHWIRNTKGEETLLSVAHALMRIMLYFTKTDLAGINNNVAKENRDNDASFDASDQVIWPKPVAAKIDNKFGSVNRRVHPLKGTNSFEILKNNFKDPYKRHEAMI